MRAQPSLYLRQRLHHHVNQLPYPISASMAAKGMSDSVARKPASRSSAATTSAFSSQQRRTAARHRRAVQTHSASRLPSPQSEEVRVGGAVFDHLLPVPMPVRVREAFQAIKITTTEAGCKRANHVSLRLTAVFPPTGRINLRQCVVGTG